MALDRFKAALEACYAAEKSGDETRIHEARYRLGLVAWNCAHAIEDALGAYFKLPPAGPALPPAERRHGVYTMPDGSVWDSRTGEITRADDD